MVKYNIGDRVRVTNEKRYFTYDKIGTIVSFSQSIFMRVKFETPDLWVYVEDELEPVSEEA